MDIKEIQRLTKLNKDIIITSFRNQGYKFLYLPDELLAEIFKREYKSFIKTKLVETDKSERAAMLTLSRNQEIFELEREFPKLNVYVMADEYARMESRLGMVTKEAISQYLSIFGYDGIRFEGDGPVINRFKRLAGNMLKEDKSHKILLVTEYIDEKNQDLPQGYYRCGIRDVLYELKEFAVPPKEIESELKSPDKFRDFVKRTVDGLMKNGWKIIFADRTPLSEWIISECVGVQYLEDIKKACISGEKIFVVKNGNLSGYYKFYQENKRSCYIDSRRTIKLIKNWRAELLCKHFRTQLREQGVSMYIVSREWGYNHPLYPDDHATSEKLEKLRRYQFSEICKDQTPYIPFLKNIYGTKYTPAYVDDIMHNIPQELELAPGKIRHENHSSQYINVTNGERYTAGNPFNSQHSVYLLGTCLFFGYAVEDKETIASYLQKRINAVYSDWRVANMGVMGAGFHNTYKAIYDMKFRKGDILIIEYGSLMPQEESSEIYDITTALNNKAMQKDSYFEWILHCNHIGYELLADKLWTIIQGKLAEADASSSDPFYLPQPVYEATDEEQRYHRQAMEYINMVKANTPERWDERVRGAIVMNCNPFTLGHQYLIRQSAAKVDHLYIFVVEEDKSFFPFKDRIELVKAGTRDIKNVVVVPSGKLIISSVTFPGYFSKDSPDSVGVDTSLDVDIFGKYIASPLGITKRFVGEEPIDVVTRSYNESMKEILPRYGIEVDEIKRKEKAGDVISASRVRKALQVGDFDLIKSLVPDTTYDYLWKNRGRFMGEK